LITLTSTDDIFEIPPALAASAIPPALIGKRYRICVEVAFPTLDPTGFEVALTGSQPLVHDTKNKPTTADKARILKLFIL
jgi:hypothetical protein